MNRNAVFVIFLCMLTIPVFGQQEVYVFDDEVLSEYEEAFDLNECKNYLEAYRKIISAEQKLDTKLTEKAMKASALSDDEFRNPYWTIKKSKAEIAYMLGVYSDMEVISQELRLSLGEKQWEGTDGRQSIVDGLWADLEKIDGSRYYLTEKYDSSEVALLKALELGSFYGNDFFICKVHDDLAQLYYKTEAYEKALAHLDSILASSPYQEDARNPETQRNIRTVQSQRALCIARLGRFEDALQEIEPVLDYFKKSNEKRLYAE